MTGASYSMAILYKSEDASGNFETYLGTIANVYSSTTMSVVKLNNYGININMTQGSFLSSTSFFIAGYY